MPTHSNKDSKNKYNHVIATRNIKVWGFDVHKIVFPVSVLFLFSLIVFVLVFTELASQWFGDLRPWTAKKFDWLYIIFSNFLVLLCFGIALSPLGKVIIGGKNATPEFSKWSWVAMLFAAGMGIGIMFYGVFEPVNHFLTPPFNIPFELGSETNKNLAMSSTIFHYGFHPWSIYALMGLCLGIFCYNKGLPLTIRSAFYPIVGDKIWGWRGDIIDIFAIIATVFGLATSLGYGALQTSGGLNYVLGIPEGFGLQVGVITVITLCAIFSVYRGLDGGIKLLSQVNIFMAICLCTFVIVVSAPIEILSNFMGNLVNYVTDLPKLSDWTGRKDSYFYHDWTVFYWSWWIAWSPFVGMFIARISKGRSVREFLLSTLLIPTIFITLWMSTFGESALNHYVNDGYTGVVDVIKNWQIELSMYKFLDLYPLSLITSIISIALVMIFFITSLDSGALIIDTMSSGGKLENPVKQRIMWCCIVSIVTALLLFSGGKDGQELAALQAFSLVAGAPFAVLMIIMCYTTIIGLLSERNSL